jgi:tetratricopeptide (TPR) repeat protein
MSLLKRIFGSKGADDHRAEADALFSRDEFGLAKLAYERALDLAPSDAKEAREAIADRIDQCCDRLAEARIRVAEEHVAAGELDIARHELEGALEIVCDPAVKKRAEELLYGMERKQAVQAAEEVEISDEDRLATIAGTWEEEQDAEYARYGDAMTEALLALFGGRPKEARAKLEALLEEASEPRYLFLEVGRARILDDDAEGGERAVTSFLELLDEDEGGAARLAAHFALASLADARDDVDGAIAHYEEAAAFFDEDPRPLFHLGRYLREKERPEEAIEVLQMAADMLADVRPDVLVLEELALAHHDAGHDERAIDLFESIISFLVSQKVVDFPVRTAATLARLHEKHGKLDRAADLWRSLASGSDRQNHVVYHREAARVLRELGLVTEARRMLERASALAENDEEAHQAIAKDLAGLDEDA